MKKIVPVQTSSNSLLDRIFLAPDLLLINVLILAFFPLTRCAFICILLLIFSLSSHLLHTGRSRSDKSWRWSVCLLRLQISDRSAVTLLLCFFAMKWYCGLVCIYLFETRFGLQGILELILLKMAFLFWSRSSWGESWLIVIKFGQLIDH